MGKQDKPEVESPRRYVKRALAGAIAKATAPVAVVEGAQGTGKTTFVRNEDVFKGYRYVTLADDETYAEASAHPADWLALQRRPVIIDDAHRIPGLVQVAQRVGPQRRVKRPSLVLVASEHMPAVEDEAAEESTPKKKGEKPARPKPPPRIERFRLYPLTQAEINGRVGCIIDDLFDGDVMKKFCNFCTRSDLRTMMRVGGFPERVMYPARALSRRSDNDALQQAGLQAVRSRPGEPDAGIDQLIEKAILERMLTSPGVFLGVDAMAAACSVDAPTLTAYLGMLQDKFLIHRMIQVDRKKAQLASFSKTRIYPTDTMFSVEALLEADRDITVEPPIFARVLRTFCLSQLLPAIQWASEPTECRHWRKFDHRIREVDIVLKRGSRLVGISIRNSIAARTDTVGALRLLAEDERFERGFIIYMGPTPRRLTDKIWAIPVSALWQNEAFLPGVSSFQESVSR